jgi:uncharacterized membrane protein YeaQ/YmgE (transglycosylase-associated protein family)
MELGTIIFIIVAGLIVGALGRLIVPGPTSLGIIGTILVGIGGALLAGVVVEYLVEPKESWVTVLIAVLCAAVLVAIFGRPRAGTLA